jgi:hypothetical protein
MIGTIVLPLGLWLMLRDGGEQQGDLDRQH